MRSRRFPANSASDCLRFAKFRHQFSESCGATYKRICELFSALQTVTILAPLGPGGNRNNRGGTLPLPFSLPSLPL